jgi:hypothetical protein
MSSCDFHVILYLYSGIDATSTLLWDYAAMKAVWDHTRSFLRHHCRLSLALTGACNFIVVQCGTHADLWLTTTFPLLWDLAASFGEAVRDQNLSLFLRHHRRLIAASLPTFISAHRRLRLHCCLTTSLSFIAALMPTCG